MMLPVVALCALSAVTSVVQSAATGSWTPPWFCHNNQCPKYTVTETHSEYEKRHYEPSVWVATSFDNIKYDTSVNSAMFFKLFHYIDSGNAMSMKIAMTSPVLVDMVLLPGDKVNATMGFMVPYELQANPPAPTDPSLFIRRMPAMDIYVIDYGGFSTTTTRDNELNMLRHDLIMDGANTNYDRTVYYTAGYDGPFTFAHRHNEVWLRALS